MRTVIHIVVAVLLFLVARVRMAQGASKSEVAEIDWLWIGALALIWLI